MVDKKLKFRINKITTVAQLTEQIEVLIKQYKISYIDAIVAYCEQHNVEVETVAALIKGNSKLKSKLQSEGETLRMLVKVKK